MELFGRKLKINEIIGFAESVSANMNCCGCKETKPCLLIQAVKELADECKHLQHNSCGEWVDKYHVIQTNGMTITGTYPTCSLCGYAEIGIEKHNNYCGNCGAKMSKGVVES